MARVTTGGGKAPKKLRIEIDPETLEQRFETEGFSGPVECREFSKRFEALAGDATSADQDTDEARGKAKVFRNA